MNRAKILEWGLDIKSSVAISSVNLNISIQFPFKLVYLILNLTVKEPLVSTVPGQGLLFKIGLAQFLD